MAEVVSTSFLQPYNQIHSHTEEKPICQDVRYMYRDEARAVPSLTHTAEVFFLILCVFVSRQKGTTQFYTAYLSPRYCFAPASHSALHTFGKVNPNPKLITRQTRSIELLL